MYQEALQLINDSKNICIFRHIHPDGDAVYSQMALYLFMKENFPDKKVKMCGFEIFDQLDTTMKVSDNFIKNSCALIIDCSVSSRIDDQRYKTAKHIIKLDHHPISEDFADLDIIDTSAGASGEVITKMLLKRPFNTMKMSKDVCKYLYCGIISDTINFITTSTTSNTLYYASKLAKKGELDVSKISAECFNESYDNYRKITAIRNKLVVEKDIGYAIIDEKDLEKLNVSARYAKNQISVFRGIKELKIWAMFVYNADTDDYSASLRSIHGYDVNELARKYGGGGHKVASGINSISLENVRNLISEIKLVAGSTN